MSENESDTTADEFVNWLCWMWAKDGERFYPPDETAEECAEEIIDGMDDPDESEKERVHNNEYGQHCRAYSEAVSKFRDAKRRGFNPVECAAREHRSLKERADGNIDPIDWSWLKDGDTYIDSLVASFEE